MRRWAASGSRISNSEAAARRPRSIFATIRIAIRRRISTTTASRGRGRSSSVARSNLLSRNLLRRAKQAETTYSRSFVVDRGSGPDVTIASATRRDETEEARRSEGRAKIGKRKRNGDRVDVENKFSDGETKVSARSPERTREAAHVRRRVRSPGIYVAYRAERNNANRTTRRRRQVTRILIEIFSPPRGDRSSLEFRTMRGVRISKTGLTVPSIIEGRIGSWSPILRKRAGSAVPSTASANNEPRRGAARGNSRPRR